MEIKSTAYDWLEVVLHQPLFDQRILGEGALNLSGGGGTPHSVTRRSADGARRSLRFGHWSSAGLRGIAPAGRIGKGPKQGIRHGRHYEADN